MSDKELNVRDDAECCPHCDSDCHALTNTVDARTFEPRGHKVACFECGALGPMGETMHEAVLKWNEMKSADFFMAMDDEEDDDDDPIYV